MKGKCIECQIDTEVQDVQVIPGRFHRRAMSSESKSGHGWCFVCAEMLCIDLNEAIRVARAEKAETRKEDEEWRKRFLRDLEGME